MSLDNDWVNTEDVTIDLVAKLDASGLKTEESSVSAFLLRSLALDREFESFASRDLSHNRHNLCVDVISRSLHQLRSSRPGSLSVIAHPPRFGKLIIANDFMFVRETLLHEASRVAYLLLGRSITLPAMGISINFEVLTHGCRLHDPSFREELADELGRSLLRLADFKKSVL